MADRRIIRRQSRLPARVGGRKISTTVIVVLGIWNGLLLVALVAVITCRKRLLEWITSADQSSDREWAAFLAQHPELGEQDAPPGKQRFSRPPR
jgi:hypothetical protein